MAGTQLKVWHKKKSLSWLNYGSDWILKQEPNKANRFLYNFLISFFVSNGFLSFFEKKIPLGHKKNLPKALKKQKQKSITRLNIINARELSKGIEYQVSIHKYSK